ncbi:hypothetical protein C8F01DRAFT_413036 [Mycena amicta]|nr:hypothetical protein C8F01DRAFT_413036 [Mycena amicta]
MQEEEEEEEDLDAPVTPGMAGIGASGRPLAFTTSSSSASPSTSTQPANDYKVLLANPDGEPRDDGPPSPSPYRLSYLTDRGYTPSLGSEDGETLEDDDRPQPELDPLTPTSYPHDFEPRTPTLTLDPKTPGMDGVFGLQQIDVEEAESPLLAAPNTNMRDSNTIYSLSKLATLNTRLGAFNPTRFDTFHTLPQLSSFVRYFCIVIGTPRTSPHVASFEHYDLAG